jgi:chromosome segregation ATPase
VVEPYRRHASTNHTAARLERWRNLLVLAPVLLTWIALMYAAYGYRIAVDTDPTLVQQPFLLLWEQGFNGLATLPFGLQRFLTLGTVALIDALLIGLLALISWRLHGLVNVAQVQADEYADELELRLSKSVWEATIELGPRLSPISAIDLSRKLSSDLLDELRAERERIAELSTERERHATALRTASRDLRDAVGSLSTVSDQMRTAMTAIHASVTAGHDQISTLVSQQASLAQLGSDLASFSDRLGGVLGTVEGVAMSLTQAVGVLAATSGGSEAAMTNLREELRALGQTLHGDRASLTTVLESLAAVPPSVDALRGSTNAAQATSGLVLARLGEFNEHVSRLDGTLGGISGGHAEFVKSVNEATRQAGAITSEAIGRLDALSQSIGNLTVQLATLLAMAQEAENDEGGGRVGLGRLLGR